MAKKIRFPLVLAEDAQVRSLEELREHFDLEAVLGYYKTGKLLTWLEDRYLEGEAKAIRALDETAPDFQLQVCEALGVEYTGTDVDLEAIHIRQERLARLRLMTDEDEFLQNIDSVAFDQEELADLLDAEQTAIYLCGERFTVPASRKGITYVGINEPEVKISGDIPVNFDELGITFCACKVDRPKPPKPEPLKQVCRGEVPQGAKIVVASAIFPGTRVMNSWRHIVSVACSDYGVIGITCDGNVLAEGKNSEQWMSALNQDWNHEWDEMCSITWGTNLIVGLRRNGTVVAQSYKGQPTVWNKVNEWTEITAVACGCEHIVGLRRDGTVVAVGSNVQGQRKVQDWRDIVSIGCTSNATYGLKQDGTVLSTHFDGTHGWTDIVSIDCSRFVIAGLKRNGTVVAEGGIHNKVLKRLSGWQDIISVACGNGFIAGVRRDRTVTVMTRDDDYGAMVRETQKWKNIVSIVAGDHVLVGIVGPKESLSHD